MGIRYATYDAKLLRYNGKERGWGAGKRRRLVLPIVAHTGEDADGDGELENRQRGESKQITPPPQKGPRGLNVHRSTYNSK